MGFATHHTHHTLDPYPPYPYPLFMGKGQIFYPRVTQVNHYRLLSCILSDHCSSAVVLLPALP